MNGTIVVNEMRSSRTYSIIWLIILVFSVAANFMGAASAGTDGGDFDVIVPFVQGIGNVVMMGAIFAMILGALIISREEDEKTIEFLLSHPVTRLEIALSKLSGFTAVIVLFNVVLLAVDIVLLEAFKTAAGYDLGAVFGVWLSALVLIYFFGAAGILLSSFVTKGGAVVGFSIGVPLIMSILNALGGVDNRLFRTLSYLSPFKYFDVEAIIGRGGARPGFIAAFIVLSAVLIAFSFGRYRRREFAV